jgi:hypothetical protein
MADTSSGELLEDGSPMKLACVFAAIVAIVSLLAACDSGDTSATGPRISSEPRSGSSVSPSRTAGSCGTKMKVTVPGQANIFGAGIDKLPELAGGGGGVPPPCVALGPDVREIRFIRATGSISFVGPWFNKGAVAHKCPTGAEVAAPVSGPDGVSTRTCGWEPDGGSIDPAGVVSGITSSDRVGYLVAVFLPNPVPAGPAPDGLDVDANYDVINLHPRMAQVFFVGDGRTTDGAFQHILVPRGASSLFLGIADAFAFRGPPGFYDDNSGRFRVEILFE